MIDWSDRLTRATGRDLGVGLALLVAVVILAEFAPSGALAAVALYAAIAVAVLAGVATLRPRVEFGLANRITLARAVMVGALTGAAVDGDIGEPGLWLVTAASASALALDGADGWVARRTGTSSPFGARFDMEIDALLIMVLAAILWREDKVGTWVLLAGLLRYGFVAASWAWPRLAAPLPPSERRRAICAVLVAGLVVACAPFVPPAAAAALAGTALALTVYSFAVDIAWLASRPDPASRAPSPAP